MDTTPKICVRFGTSELPVSGLRKTIDTYSKFDILPSHPFPLEGIIDEYDLIIFVVDTSFKNTFGYELVSSKIGEHIIENDKKCIVLQLNNYNNKCFSEKDFDDNIIEIGTIGCDLRTFVKIVGHLCHRIEIKKATKYFVDKKNEK